LHLAQYCCFWPSLTRCSWRTGQLTSAFHR
jgi:hypothetical protein